MEKELAFQHCRRLGDRKNDLGLKDTYGGEVIFEFITSRRDITLDSCEPVARTGTKERGGVQHSISRVIFRHAEYVCERCR